MNILRQLNTLADTPGLTFIGDTICPQTDNVREIIRSLQRQSWMPVTLVASDSKVGRVEMEILNATRTPIVRFVAIPVNNTKLPQNFDDMEAALRYVGFTD